MKTKQTLETCIKRLTQKGGWHSLLFKTFNILESDSSPKMYALVPQLLYKFESSTQLFLIRVNLCNQWQKI